MKCLTANSNKWQRKLDFVSCAQVAGCQKWTWKKKQKPLWPDLKHVTVNTQKTNTSPEVMAISSSNNKYKSISKEDTPCFEM